MTIFYAFVAFLGFALFQASRSVAEEDGDIPLLYSGNNLFMISSWFIITGLLLPVVMLFIMETWYLAFLYIIVGIVLAMVIGNQFTYNMHVVKRPPFYIPSRVDARPAIIVSIISLVLLVITFM